MAQTQLNGATQIRSASIGDAQIAAAAGIALTKLSKAVVAADGSQAMTANLSLGGFKATNAADPTTSTDLATKNYVDTVAQGLANKYSAHAATFTETLTVASGSVTQIAGTTVDGVSVAVNDYVLVLNAGASTGAAGGLTLSSQPANGLYQVSAVAANITVSRAVDMSGSNGPYGSYTFVVGGANWGGAGFVVTTPSTPAAFTYGTGNIGLVQFSGAGEITTDTTLVKTGNQLSRAAITGDVTIGSNSNAATIANSAVTLAKMAALAANSVIGNSTGSSATPTAVAMSIAAAASAIALRDANSNLFANAIVQAAATTPTAAGTTTLTAASAPFQQFTGVTTQTVVTPNATGLTVGWQYEIANRSTGAVQINMNGGGALATVAAGAQVWITLITNGTAAGTWDTSSSAGGTVTSASVTTANGFQGTVATASTTPAITIQTSLGAGVIKSNGSNAIALATAGTDYLAPTFVANETPGGSINGANAAFTLAFTPIMSSLMLVLNGDVLEPGSGNDYTISGLNITMLLIPSTGDKLRAYYWK